MNKKLLKVGILLCMTLIFLGMSRNQQAQASAIDVAVAKINGESYSSLKKAVEAVREGEIIQLMTGITLEGTVTIEKINNLTLDLNGCKLDGGSNCAIDYKGAGTLTITDGSDSKNGLVTSCYLGSWGTIKISKGNLILAGGVVENTHTGEGAEHAYAIYVNGTSLSITGGMVTSNERAIYSTGLISVRGGTVQSKKEAIFNYGSKGVVVEGGTVKSTSHNAISNYASGSVKVTGGTVESGVGSAIFNVSSASVNISGGTVKGKLREIYNHLNGKISISGEAELTSDDATTGTIYL